MSLHGEVIDMERYEVTRMTIRYPKGTPANVVGEDLMKYEGWDLIGLTEDDDHPFEYKEIRLEREVVKE